MNFIKIGRNANFAIIVLDFVLTINRKLIVKFAMEVKSVNILSRNLLAKTLYVAEEVATAFIINKNLLVENVVLLIFANLTTFKDRTVGHAKGQVFAIIINLNRTVLHVLLSLNIFA